MKIIKIKLSLAVLSILSIESVFAFRILIDTNTLEKDDIGYKIASPSEVDYSQLSKLRADGVWTLALHNSLIKDEDGNLIKDEDGKSIPDFSYQEKKKVYEHLGPRYVVAEDGSFTVVNFDKTLEITGYINDYMSYNETWMFDKNHPTHNGLYDFYKTSGLFTDSELDNMWATQRTVLNGKLIDFITQNLQAGGISTQRLSASTRDYISGEISRNAIDLLDGETEITSFTVEMIPYAANIDAWEIDELITKAFAQNRLVYLLLTPDSLHYIADLKHEYNEYINVLRNKGLLDDPRLFIVVANYYHDSKTPGVVPVYTSWLDNGVNSNNSMEKIIAHLKDQPEWNTQSSDIFIGNFNGDSVDDIMHRNTVSDGTAFWYAVSGDASPIHRPWDGNLIPGWPGNGQYYAGDFNGDGTSDLAYLQDAGYWYIVDGASGAPISHWWGKNIPGWPGNGNYYIGDFNGDNASDIAYLQVGTANWYIVDGASGGPIGHWWGKNIPGWPANGDYYIGDFNGDNASDIAFLQAGTANWYIVNGASGGPIGHWWGKNIPGWPANGDYYVGDFNGDNAADIAYLQTGTANWYIVDGVSGGPIGHWWGYSISGWSSNGEYYIGDFNGDNTSDIAHRLPTNDMKIFNGATKSFFTISW